MIANFHINYGTKQGEQIAILFRHNGLEETFICQSYDAVNWHAAVYVVQGETVEYKYVLQSLVGMLAEQGVYRQLTIPTGYTRAFYQDFWRAEYEPTRAFFSAAFRNVIFKRLALSAERLATPNREERTISRLENQLIFQLYAAAIPPQWVFGIVGDRTELGNWQKPIVLSDKHFPLWQVAVSLSGNQVHCAYKYVIMNPDTQEIVEWEAGENRKCQFSLPSSQGNVLVRTDECFRYGGELWRGAGMAIPVFSLRSEQGGGIGEFTDLKLLVDWARQTGMRLVQILPVNDTVATKTWLDSYPYAAISVYALHPYYVHLESIAPIQDADFARRGARTQQQLNQLEVIDFDKVGEFKMAYFKILFQQEKDNFFADPAAQNFIQKNADWLKPYAVFCHLRDMYGTVEFHRWGQYSVFSENIIQYFCNSKYADYESVVLYYFIQYHAHRQLFAATQYARSQGIVLKGDLPIGIYRHSCDAWVAPQLYNMDGQAGAPPDAYAVAGQNWGFPTYNWEVMAKDNFAWWRMRMTQLSQYFDALRIDHILGFFRIWQIPITQVEGTLGMFNPRLPYSRQELDTMGLRGNLDRYTQPYIRAGHLSGLFGQDAAFVREHFLHEGQHGVLRLREFVDNQLKIKQLFAKQYADKKHLESKLMRLVGEVLLIEEPNSDGKAFNPRITVHTTRSYQELDDFEKYIIHRLYDDYFFRRHDEFWRQQALWKLPALLHATDMLICGEDLGMIPNSVPSVMRDLNIIALEIQRMPKGKTDFGVTQQYPYMSVCSPSCHDMSTIRGWWESDFAHAQKFYTQSLQKIGGAPRSCTPEIVQAILEQHLQAPSMWAIFPIQDLLGMDANSRRADAAAEQINEPSNPQHYWRFRLHISVETLLEQTKWNEKIKKMIQASGR